MNKHVSKLLQPGVFWYCLILLGVLRSPPRFWTSIIWRQASWL